MSDQTGKTAQDIAAARERGYNGGIRQVHAAHIQDLVASATRLIRMIDGRTFPEPAPGAEVEGSFYTERSIERAENLLEHAAQELRDERLRLRDGWSA